MCDPFNKCINDGIISIREITEKNNRFLQNNIARYKFTPEYTYKSKSNPNKIHVPKHFREDMLLKLKFSSAFPIWANHSLPEIISFHKQSGASHSTAQ